MPAATLHRARLLSCDALGTNDLGHLLVQLHRALAGDHPAAFQRNDLAFQNAVETVVRKRPANSPSEPQH